MFTEANARQQRVDEVNWERLFDGNIVPPRLMVGDPFLVVQLRPDDVGERPPAQFPHASSAVRVLRDGRPTNSIEPSEDLFLSCEVRNFGDVAVPNVTVEFFVSHSSRPRAEEEPFVLKVEEVRRTRVFRGLQRVRGIVRSGKLHIGDKLDVMRDLDVVYRAIRVRRIAAGGPTNSVGSGAEATLLLGSVGFRRGRSLRLKVGDLLTEPREQFDPAPSARTISDLVGEVEFVGSGRVYLAPGETGRVTMPYRTPTEAMLGTVIYARAFSLSPSDIPADFERLDYKASRHVGRAELKWRTS
jgi:hypothetical protein